MTLLVSKSQFAVAIVAALLLAIWPLPGTIAFRHLLLLIGSFFSLYVIWQFRKTVLKNSAWHLHVLMLFFIWLVFHYLLFSSNHQEQLQELRGDWLRALLATTIGLAVGLSVSTPEARGAKQLKIILVAGFSGTVLIFFFRYAYEIYLTGDWLHQDFFMTPYKSKPALVIFGILLVPHAYQHILLSLQDNRAGARIYASIAGIFLIVFAFYFANTKNGFLVLFFSMALLVVHLLRRRRQALKNRLFVFFSIVLLSLLFVPVKTHIQSNPAWQMLLADAKVAVDINEHPYWKNRKIYPVPKNEYGVPVNGSTYERLSWATAGIQLIQEHPMGYGLIHHSFGALAAEKWPDFEINNRETRGATHSGWVDFTLGLGLPGLLLVVLPLCISFYRSLARHGYWHDYVAWAIPILLVAYTVTEVSSDHFIELLFFLTAMFCGVTAKNSVRNSTSTQGATSNNELAA